MSDPISGAGVSANPQPRPSHAAPKCVDCQHLIREQDRSAVRPGPSYWCKAPGVPINLIDGRPTQDCQRMRADRQTEREPVRHPHHPGLELWLGACGPDGLLFTPREASDAAA